MEIIAEAALERLRIAVRVLNSRHFHSAKVTDSEIEILKFYLGQEFSNVTVEEIAAAVIRRELKLEDSSRTHENKRQHPTAM